MSADSYEREPGLAAERTELAWDRSALSLFACGATVVKGVPSITGSSGRPLPGLAILALAGLAWASGMPYARTRSHATRLGQRAVIRRRELLPMALGTMFVGIAGFFIAALMPL
jgi:uncharacterized membrane protein YidH (DUF202 family)